MSAVKLTVEFDNLEAAQIFLSNHLGFEASVPSHPASPPPVAIVMPSTLKPAVHVEVPAKPVKAPKPTPVTLAKPANGPVIPAAAPALTYDNVKAACMKLANKKGREALVKMLSNLGLANAQEAKPEQYARVVENCEIAFLAEDALA